MSQIHLHPISVPKVQSFAHLQKQTLGVQIKIRFVFFPLHIVFPCYILYEFIEFISGSFPSPHTNRLESPGWMPNGLLGAGIHSRFPIPISLCEISQSARNCVLSTLAPSVGRKWPMLPKFPHYGFVCSLQIKQNSTTSSLNIILKCDSV